MVDVPQPSSLTLELNPFEQSFASKTSDEASPKPANGPPPTTETPGGHSQPATSGYAPPPFHTAQSQSNAVKTEAIFPKTVTPLPMVPNGAGPFPPVVSGPTAIPSPAQWMSNQLGPFTPSVPGIGPSYESFHPPGMRPGLPHQVSNNGPPLHTPGGMSVPSPAAPTNGYAPPFANMPLESPGIFMPVPVHPKYQFPVIAPSPMAAHPNVHPNTHPNTHPNAHSNAHSNADSNAHANAHPNAHPNATRLNSTHCDSPTPGTPNVGVPPASAASHAAANSLYLLNHDGHHPDAKAPSSAAARAAGHVSAPLDRETTQKRSRALVGDEPRREENASQRVKHTSPPVITPTAPPTNAASSSSPAEADSAELKRAARDGPDDDRRKQFLERNRIAAVKCRQRKKQWVDELKTKADALSRANDDLRSKNMKLENDMAQLVRFVLHAHPLETLPGHVASVISYQQHSLKGPLDPSAPPSIPGGHQH